MCLLRDYRRRGRGCFLLVRLPSTCLLTALDAYCLVEVYDFVQHRAAELGLDFNELLTHSPADTNEAKPSKSKSNRFIPLFALFKFIRANSGTV